MGKVFRAWQRLFETTGGPFEVVRVEKLTTGALLRRKASEKKGGEERSRKGGIDKEEKICFAFCPPLFYTQRQLGFGPH